MYMQIYRDRNTLPVHLKICKYIYQAIFFSAEQKHIYERHLIKYLHSILFHGIP